MRRAKKTKGISMSALLKSVGIGILAKRVAVMTRVKKPIKAGQRVMGVDTTTRMNAMVARILTWDGSE
jgi:hypothetical protein